MIDHEYTIFMAVEEALQSYPKVIEMSGAPPQQIANLPFVLFHEIDNSHVNRLRTQETDDQFVRILYEAQVFSNSNEGKIKECKDIAALIDGAMTDMGFTRFMNTPYYNHSDPSIARRIMRFEAVADANGVIYRR